MKEQSDQGDVEELRGTRAVRLPRGGEAGREVIVTALYLRLETLIDDLRAIHPGGPGTITVGVGELEVTGLVKLSLLGQDVLTESSLGQHDGDAEIELGRRLAEADILEIPGLKPDSVAVVLAPELVRERLVPGSRGELDIGAWTTRYRSARLAAPDAPAVATSERPSAARGGASMPAVGLAAAALAALAAAANGGLTLFGVLSAAPVGMRIAAGSLTVFGFGIAVALAGVWLHRRLRPCQFARRAEVQRDMAAMAQRMDIQDKRLEAAGV